MPLDSCEFGVCSAVAIFEVMRSIGSSPALSDAPWNRMNTTDGPYFDWDKYRVMGPYF